MMQTEEGRPKGCLLVMGKSNCSPDQKVVQTLLSEERERVGSGFVRCCRKAVESGELSSGVDVEALAAMLCSFLFGLTSLARDKVSEPSLEASVRQIMAVWDVHRGHART